MAHRFSGERANPRVYLRAYRIILPSSCFVYGIDSTAFPNYVAQITQRPTTWTAPQVGLSLNLSREDNGTTCVEIRKRQDKMTRGVGFIVNPIITDSKGTKRLMMGTLEVSDREKEKITVHKDRYEVKNIATQRDTNICFYVGFQTTGELDRIKIKKYLDETGIPREDQIIYHAFEQHLYIPPSLRPLGVTLNAVREEREFITRAMIDVDNSHKSRPKAYNHVRQTLSERDQYVNELIESMLADRETSDEGGNADVSNETILAGGKIDILDNVQIRPPVDDINSINASVENIEPESPQSPEENITPTVENVENDAGTQQPDDTNDNEDVDDGEDSGEVDKKKKRNKRNVQQKN